MCQNFVATSGTSRTNPLRKRIHNECDGGDGAIPLLLHSERARPAAPHHEWFGEGHAHLFMKAFGTTDQGGWVLGFVMLVWWLVFKHIEEIVVRHYNATRPNWRATS